MYSSASSPCPSQLSDSGKRQIRDVSKEELQKFVEEWDLKKPPVVTELRVLFRAFAIYFIHETEWREWITKQDKELWKERHKPVDFPGGLAWKNPNDGPNKYKKEDLVKGIAYFVERYKKQRVQGMQTPGYSNGTTNQLYPAVFNNLDIDPNFAIDLNELEHFVERKLNVYNNAQDDSGVGSMPKDIDGEDSLKQQDEQQLSNFNDQQYFNSTAPHEYQESASTNTIGQHYVVNYRQSPVRDTQCLQNLSQSSAGSTANVQASHLSESANSIQAQPTQSHNFVNIDFENLSYSYVNPSQSGLISQETSELTLIQSTEDCSQFIRSAKPRPIVSTEIHSMLSLKAEPRHWMGTLDNSQLLQNPEHQPTTRTVDYSQLSQIPEPPPMTIAEEEDFSEYLASWSFRVNTAEENNQPGPNAQFLRLPSESMDTLTPSSTPKPASPKEMDYPKMVWDEAVDEYAARQ